MKKTFIITLSLLLSSHYILSMEPASGDAIDVPMTLPRSPSISTLVNDLLSQHQYRNIIWDLGGVLLDGSSQEFIARIRRVAPYVPDNLSEAVKTQAWIDWDRGLIDTDQLIAALCRTYDRHHVNLFMAEYLNEERPLIKETLALLKDLKKRGFRNYLLSNFSYNCRDIFCHRYKEELFDLFDGIVFSSEKHHVKPGRELYEIALSDWGIIREESLFIDDSSANCAAAEALGIKSVLFKKSTP